MLQGYLIKIAGYSQAKVFKFISYDDNVALWHKSSSLQTSWQGLSSDSIKGILIFSDVPSHDIITEIILSKELDNELIETLLKNPNITCYFALQNTTFFCSTKLSMLIFVKLLYRQHVLFAI